MSYVTVLPAHKNMVCAQERERKDRDCMDALVDAGICVNSMKLSRWKQLKRKLEDISGRNPLMAWAWGFPDGTWKQLCQGRWTDCIGREDATHGVLQPMTGLSQLVWFGLQDMEDRERQKRMALASGSECQN